MKFFLLLLSFSVHANEFQLKESGARFTLKISSDEVFYDSESFTKRVPVKNCNKQLAVDLNTELFSYIPDAPEKEGLTIYVDKKPIKLPEKSIFLMMDARMMRFLAEEKKRCL